MRKADEDAMAKLFKWAGNMDAKDEKAGQDGVQAKME